MLHRDNMLSAYEELLKTLIALNRVDPQSIVFINPILTYNNDERMKGLDEYMDMEWKKCTLD